MPDRVLTLRELNRATLALQLLLAREPLSAADTIGRLAGLQAQAMTPPFVGLWTRLEGFRSEDLTDLADRRKVVRATMMRHTLHLVGADDYIRLRPAVQPALTRAFFGVARKRVEGLDLDPLVAAARERLEEGPATFAEIRALVAGREPKRDPNVLAYAVRTFVPLVQVPAGGRWGYSSTAPYALAEDWLRRPVPYSEDPRELVKRYLAAFGPAATRDVHAWSGLAGLKESVEELRPELRTFRDERGTELFDVPDGPVPAGDVPAPVRFLPDYDNALLAHSDRSRVIADEHRRKVFLTNGRVRATFLIDGFVRGTWKVERDKDAATLLVEPFGRLAKTDREALATEGERLLGFLEERGGSRSIRIAKPA
jgi:DNA glycosylase AlkZ-like